MNKVTIVGAGMVGSTAAFSILAKNLVEELAIIDLNEKLAVAQVMDLQHSVPFFGQAHVKVGTYEDCKDSDITIVTCGAAQKPGQSRLDLIKTNAKIIRSVVSEVFAYNPDSILIMVTNPVDVLTQIAVTMFPDKKKQIFGTGTVLDSARLCYALGDRFGINPQSVHAYIVGEHGDSEFPLWTGANIGGSDMENCYIIPDVDKEAIADEVKNSAYAIIEGKQSTYYAIGAGVAHIVDVVLKDKRNVLPVSYAMDGEYGIEDVCLSMPAIVGCGGIEGRICLKLTDDELSQLQASAHILKTTIEGLS